MEFPMYRAAAADDGGADVADAIGLGVWWMRRIHPTIVEIEATK
jgi:hypothetical protein